MQPIGSSAAFSLKKLTAKFVLSCAFTALWLIDTATTSLFVSVLGPDSEANPVMRSLIEQAGIGGFIAVKMAVLLFWLSINRHAHWVIHAALVAIMIPVAVMGVGMLLII